MPLSRQFIGRTTRSDNVYEVSREKIRDFAVAVGSSHSVHRDADSARAAGYPDVIAPPTFLTALEVRMVESSPLTDPDLGLDIRRVVHGGQRFVAHRPVVAGDRLVLTTVVEDIRDAGRNEVIVVRHDVDTEAGEKVASITSTMVSRGTAVGEQAGR